MSQSPTDPSSTIYLCFDLSSSHDDDLIEIQVQLDHTPAQVIAARTQPTKISLAVDDLIEGPHELQITLRGKTAAHTQLDAQGNIVQDVVVGVDLDSCTLDGMTIGALMVKMATYTHNHNGTTPQGTHRFYGVMGCNGTVSLKFHSPAYLWLLENL